jgi:ATP-dependent helicase HrpB
MRQKELPIHEVAKEIVAGVQEAGRVVLRAPTGSGKSTQVPQILLDQAAITGAIVVLQPRRLAARMLAGRVAAERGVKLGGEVGYQIRFENRVCRDTRIRFVTEAILLRQILSDPKLPGVGAIVLDEFHERHLTSDLSLACALESVQTVRPDLKLVVMSATLEMDAVAEFLKPAVAVEAMGRMYPVEVRYMGAALGRQAAPVWTRAAQAFREVVRAGQSGDVLIFMAGAYEIRRTLSELEALPESRGYELLPLHGELSPEAQDRAVQKGSAPKVIVSTNVAETSITIEGVRVVIDGGQARIARYDVRRGINALLVEPISRAAAEQRKGRAGRTGPGLCLRLWSETEQVGRTEQDTPELKRVDLAETILLLSAAGIKNPRVFKWFEKPEEKALERAQDLLFTLGAIDSDGVLIARGGAMARMPLHPRFALMLLEASERGVLETVALIAALSQGRAVYRAGATGASRSRQLEVIEDSCGEDSDWLVQVRAWEVASAAKFNKGTCVDLGIHAAAARQAGTAAQQLQGLIPKSQTSQSEAPATAEALATAVGQCLLAGFSDYLALRSTRGTRRCRLMHGKGGELRRESVVVSELFVATEQEERQVRGEVTLLLGMATRVEPSWLQAQFPDDFSDVQETRYDTATRRVVCARERRFRDLVLANGASGEPDADKAASLLAAEVVAGRLLLKHWNQAVETWITRVNFVAKHCPETEILPLDAEGRQLLIEQICDGALSYKAIKDREVLPIVKEWISPEQKYYLDTYAPTTIDLPRRKRPAVLRYESDGRVFIASKLQDFYDVKGSSLKIAKGKVPLLVELLAPSGRPAHVTDDLDGFWEGAYAHVRKELAGRYPKHEWR